MNAVVTQEQAPPRAIMQPSMAAELLRIVVEQNQPMEKIEKMLDLQDRWERRQAEKAFNASLAKFREQHIKVFRSAQVKQGPMAGTTYARLSDFVGSSASALSSVGLSAAWKIVKQEKDWIDVACVIRHCDGHQEETVMGGPVDTSGAKNPIQARASTVTYLEKYTLKMALGLAEQDDDDDGNGGPENAPGQTRGAPPAAAPKVEKPAYPDSSLDKNHDVWFSAIQEGKKTPDEIISMVESRYTLTDAQRKTIRGLAPEVQA